MDYHMNQLRQATAAVDAEMRQLREQVARARRERDSARHQRDLATNQGDIARAEAASAVDALGAMRGERDRFRRAYAEATAKTSRLESTLHRFTAGKSWEERHLNSADPSTSSEMQEHECCAEERCQRQHTHTSCRRPSSKWFVK